MAHFHPSLTHEKWNNYSCQTQILNIASELTRAKNRLQKGNRADLHHSLDRALELIDLTINDRRKWQASRLRELLRLREMIGDFYNPEHSSAEELNGYLRVLLFFHPETSEVEI